jgi:hypothetical protein
MHNVRRREKTCISWPKCFSWNNWKVQETVINTDDLIIDLSHTGGGNGCRGTRPGCPPAAHGASQHQGAQAQEIHTGVRRLLSV